MKCKIYNLKIAVKNLEEGSVFFRSVFSELGFGTGRLYDDPIDGKPTIVFGNGAVYLEIVEEPSLVPPNDLSSVAGPRLEFLAESKEQVDQFHEHLLKYRAKVLCSPQYLFEDLLGSRETDPWYGVYFVDPSGNKFGLVYTLEAGKVPL